MSYKMRTGMRVWDENENEDADETNKNVRAWLTPSRVFEDTREREGCKKSTRVERPVLAGPHVTTMVTC